MVESFLFNNYLLTLSDALDVAEDKTGDFFKFSFGQWKRHNYDVKTQIGMKKWEMAPCAFALLNKYSGPVRGQPEIGSRKRDFYYICLQDRQIANALKEDENLRLLPLLIYIFTHELVHIVRFCNFSQIFDISGKKRDKEERIVHEITYEILQNLSIPNLGYILDVYKSHRICEMRVL